MADSATTRPVFALRFNGGWHIKVGGVQIIDATTQKRADAAVEALSPYGGERPHNGRIEWMRGLAKRAMEAVQ